MASPCLHTGLAISAWLKLPCMRQVNVDNIDADLFGTSTQNPFPYTPQDPSVALVRNEAALLVQQAYIDGLVRHPFVIHSPAAC